MSLKILHSACFSKFHFILTRRLLHCNQSFWTDTWNETHASQKRLPLPHCNALYNTNTVAFIALGRFMPFGITCSLPYILDPGHRFTPKRNPLKKYKTIKATAFSLILNSSFSQFFYFLFTNFILCVQNSSKCLPYHFLFLFSSISIYSTTRHSSIFFLVE